MNELELLGAADPASFSASDEAREELFSALKAGTEPQLAPARRRRMGVLVASACVLSLGGGGLAYAVLAGQPAETALKVNCAAGISKAQFGHLPGFTAVIDTMTGDPVADCAAEYERLEGDAPALAGYDVGRTMIYVVPESWAPPAEWRRLPPTFRSDPLRLELKQRLQDRVDGPNAGCSTSDEADRYARAQLTELGLTTYTVERLSQAGMGNGVTYCGRLWLAEDGSHRVLLQGVEADDWSGGPTYRGIAERLRTWISQSCVALAEAERLARRAVTEAGLTLRSVPIRALADPTASCTRVDLVQGPPVDYVIFLHGPTSAAGR